MKHRGLTCVPGCCYEESDTSMKNHPREEIKQERRILPNLTPTDPHINPVDRIMTVEEIERRSSGVFLAKIQELKDKLASTHDLEKKLAERDRLEDLYRGKNIKYWGERALDLEEKLARMTAERDKYERL